jgi:hypothetical protein
MFNGAPNVLISAELTVAPEVVYSAILPELPVRLKVVTNKFPSETAMPPERFSPEISAGFTVAPEVVYSPIVPVSKFVTKICAGIVTGIAQSAEATQAKRVNRIFIWFLSKSKRNSLQRLIAAVSRRRNDWALSDQDASF